MPGQDDDFELSTEELEQTTAALSNNAYKRRLTTPTSFSLNRFKYLKALEKNANKLYNLFILAARSEKGSTNVSNNKF